MRLDCAWHGQIRRAWTQLFLWYRSYRLCWRNASCYRWSLRMRWYVFADDTASGSHSSGSHGRRLCFPRRSAFAPWSRFDAFSDPSWCSPSLLWRARAELGTCGDDQSAPYCRGSWVRQTGVGRAGPLRLAQISRLRGNRRRPFHQAADPRP